MNIAKYDMICGTVIEKRRNGVIVQFDNAKGFCKGNMNIGDNGWFTVTNYRIDMSGLFLTVECDSVIEYAIVA